VKVHVLLDWQGSQKMDEAALASMRTAGVEVERYHPVKWYTLSRFNNRTHRKLLVVDGVIGLHRRRRIADKWSGNAQDPDHWRDTHYRVEGPVVAQMQAAFMDNWTKVTGKVLHTAEYFPPEKPRRRPLRAGVSKLDRGRSGSMHLMYLLSIAAAARSIDLSMAYFAPDDLALATLVAALRRGVKVRILLPGPHTDAEIVQNASRAKWGELLSSGAEIHLYQPTMFHCKVLVVDGLLDVRRLHQLRQPVVPPERRSQSERLRRRGRGPADRDLRRRSSEIPANDLRGVGSASPAREAYRSRCRPVQCTALTSEVRRASSWCPASLLRGPFVLSLSKHERPSQQQFAFALRQAQGERHIRGTCGARYGR
jgi:NAD(P)H-hydrate repair Nnr-like enzyme with NAD(P)H-hydrate epimerase domain